MNLAPAIRQRVDLSVSLTAATMESMRTGVAEKAREVIGDYESFFTDLMRELRDVGIELDACPLSHLGYTATTLHEYERVRDRLVEVSGRYLENEHNGRPIAKVILRGELPLPAGFTVSMVEIMPPKSRPAARYGLEHCGFVLGDGLDEFIAAHANVLTGRQDQGPFCQPAYVSLASGRRAKFYDRGLETVVTLEGHEFVVPSKP